MGKRVISSISYTKGTFTDCVDSISVDYITVADAEELSAINNKIEALEENISILKQENEMLRQLVRQSLHDLQEINSSGCREIAECRFESDRRIMKFSSKG